MAELNLERLITGYIALRDKKGRIKKEQEEVLKEYTDAMTKIEQVLKAHLNANDLQSIATDSGTAFIRTKRSATVADKSALREYVIANRNFDLVDFSPKVEAVEDFVGENKGLLPPGVNFTAYETVGVQRK